MPRFFAPVLFAELCLGAIFGGNIFNPVGKFFYSAAAYVAAQVGLYPEHFAQVEELMRAKAVVFDCASPVVVYHARTIFFWAYAVFPVIFIGKATAGPAENGNMQGAECLEHVVAITVSVGYGGILAHPYAAIDAGAEVFGKLAVDFLIDCRRILARVQVYRHTFFGSDRNCR